MKKSVLFSALFLLVTLSANATIRTVSNSPSTTIAQFSTIQAAINASSSGDTVYVNGSPNNYASFTITNKKLLIIGPGWSPDKNSSFVANVPGCTITGSGSNNTELQGLVFTSNVNVTSGANSNFRFIRNKFNNPLHIDQFGEIYSGFLFEGNTFTNMTVNGGTSSFYMNFVFQNNYFYGTTVSLFGFNRSTNTVLLTIICFLDQQAEVRMHSVHAVP